MNHPITCAVLDQETESRQALVVLIERYCPNAQVVATFASAQAATSFLAHQPPDLLFLEVGMAGETGLQMLEILPRRAFHVVFVSAMERFGVAAIRAGALDYLLKPIEVGALQLTLDKAQRIMPVLLPRDHAPWEARPRLRGRAQRKAQHILLPIQHGVQLMPLEQLAYLQADGNYTELHLQGSRVEVVSKLLNSFAWLEEEHYPDFARVSRSQIIHLSYLDRYERLDGGRVTMQNGQHFKVTAKYAESFEEALCDFGHGLGGRWI